MTISMGLAILATICGACSRSGGTAGDSASARPPFLQDGFSQNAALVGRHDPAACSVEPSETQTALPILDGTEADFPRHEFADRMSGDTILEGHSLLLSEAKALEIVNQHFGNRFANRMAAAKFEREGNRFIVTIPPRSMDASTGHSRYGASYSVRAVLDGESGEVIETRIGR